MEKIGRVYIYIMDSIQNMGGVLFHYGSAPWPCWWDKRAYYSKEYIERLKFQEPGRESIFFGPCKKEMRREIREDMNKFSSDSFYIVGLSNAIFKPRILVYFMEIERKMTFREAYNKYPTLRGTGIHIKPTGSKYQYTVNHYGRKRVELKYKHLGIFLSCKSAPHSEDWVKDVGGDQLGYKTLGPDCCFMGSQGSVFFGKNHVRIDGEFCEISKNGKLFKGTLNKNLIDINNPIPSARGNHLILSGEGALRMVGKLKELVAAICK